MRHLMATTTPQHVVNECMRCVGLVTGRRGTSLLPGSKLDHFGFVVSAEAFAGLCMEFSAWVWKALWLVAPEAGQAIEGMQTSPSRLCWYIDNVVPAFAVVQGAEGFPVPVGGAYIVVTFNSKTQAYATLRRLDLRFEITSLYGLAAYRVCLAGAGGSVGPSVHSLHVMTDDLMSIVSA